MSNSARSVAAEFGTQSFQEVKENLKRLQPLYFVLHPDQTYSVADPQPTLITPSDERVKAVDSLVADQLKFLLFQAPLMDAPELARILQFPPITTFAYCHPKTFARYKTAAVAAGPSRAFYLVGPRSQTKWFLTSLLPEGGVIFTSGVMPGFEKILEG